MKKGDKLIILILILCAAGWLGLDRMGKENDATKIVIEVEGNPYKTINMNTLSDKSETMHIELPGGKYFDLAFDKTGAYVTDVDCPDKLCHKTGKIESVGQSIVCLPNKVVVIIEGKATSDVDQVTY